MPFIDWERVATGVEKAGARLSGSIMRKLELGEEEVRQKRMFTFRMGEETKARRELMEYGNEVAMDLAERKATLVGELQPYLGSPQVRDFVTEAVKTGRPEGMVTMDLMGRLDRNERVTPEDRQLVQTLPLEVQSPISKAMGVVDKYYQEEDRETIRFKKWGTHIDAQTEALKAQVEALRTRAQGVPMTPEQAMKLKDSATKGLVALQGDELFQFLLRKTSRDEELRPDELVAWKDLILRWNTLHGTIRAADLVLGQEAELPEVQEIEQPKVKGKFTKAFTEGWFPEEGWMGNVDRFVQDLIMKGYIGVGEGAEKFMAWFKKVIKAVGAGEWEEPIK